MHNDTIRLILTLKSYSENSEYHIGSINIGALLKPINTLHLNRRETRVVALEEPKEPIFVVSLGFQVVDWSKHN